MPRSRRRPSGKPRTSPAALERLHPHAARIYCGSAEHYVAVPPDRDPTPVQCFSTFTTDLHRLADWLAACRITHVAMEATGVYWIPVFEILEARGFDVILVDPSREERPWPQSATSPIVSGSGICISSGCCAAARPVDAIVALRGYLRHRATLVESTSMLVQRMQKALVQMNVQLTLVVTDITGLTGLRILRDIAAGIHNPQQLADHRDPRCRASPDEIVAAFSTATIGQNTSCSRILPSSTPISSRWRRATPSWRHTWRIWPPTPRKPPRPSRRPAADRSRRITNRDLICEDRSTSSPGRICRSWMASGRTPRCASCPRLART